MNDRLPIDDLSAEERTILRAMLCVDLISGAAIAAEMPKDQVDSNVETIIKVLTNYNSELAVKLARKCLELSDVFHKDENDQGLREFLLGETKW